MGQFQRIAGLSLQRLWLSVLVVAQLALTSDCAHFRQGRQGTQVDVSLIQTDWQVDRQSKPFKWRPRQRRSAQAYIGSPQRHILGDGPARNGNSSRGNDTMTDTLPEARDLTELGDLSAVLPISSIMWVRFASSAAVMSSWIHASSNSSNLPDAVSTLTEKCKDILKSAEDGSRVMMKKVDIAASAVRSATSSSVQEAYKGNLSGVPVVAKSALTEAFKRNELVNRTMSRSSSQGFGILLVILLVALIWFVELSLSSGSTSLPFEQRSDAEPTNVGFLHGLTFMRYLMSWYVVIYNFYTPAQVGYSNAWAVFAEWGALSGPWFFMVSGFVNSYSKCLRSKIGQHEDFMEAAWRRIATWYPFFIIGLLWCVAGNNFTSRAQDWSHFMANTFLVHRLAWGEDYFPFYIGDWWLCFLAVYLLTWAPIHRALSESDNSILWTLFVMGWVSTIPITFLEWLFMGEFPLFRLVAYWPSFAYGQALAHWFVMHCMKLELRKDSPLAVGEEVYTLKPEAELPVIVQYGVTPIVVGLCTFFFTVSPRDELPFTQVTLEPLFLRGGLLPVLAVLILGLASGVDPLARFFSRTPFRWFGKLALMNYLFHVPLRRSLAQLEGNSDDLSLTASYVFLLFLTTIALHYALERPFRHYLGVYEK
mmetsp:Transcript_58910/g.137678  ORF Transcript_58910/g.137678 Transcript_58910/m.137678 type:complete len:649 (+) Transcript_58910:120-2066(+)